ncbi:MATE family efflux transporter [Novosphingobium bradum]|uniref:MATE family efflux transporter n=1 Tax=Novosphingobium bradum TaxID=1737444 RepID=A0ABV7IT76_9SPHN
MPKPDRAAAGHARNLTEGPIGRTLITFAIPTLFSNVLQSLNGSINSIWVGRFLGESALAATANGNVIMFLMMSAVFGFGIAAMVLVGQAIGRRDLPAARQAFGSALGFNLGLSLLVMALGWLCAPQMLRLLATPPSYYAEALIYLRVVFLSMPGIVLFIMMTMGLRGSGDSLTPLWFIGLAVVLDAGLNPVFILGLGPAPRLGIAGSGVATAIANYGSSIALLAWIYRRDLPLRLRGRELRWLVPGRRDAWGLVSKGLPMGLQMIVVSGAGLVFMGFVNREGMLTAAAYAAVQQVWTYMQMPAMAIAAAVSGMASQNVGAGRWDRVNAIARHGIAFHLAITGAVLVLILAFDRPVLQLFLGAHSPAVEIARHIQLIASATFLIFGIPTVLFGVMRANGVVIAPLLVIAIAMFPVRLIVYWLGYPGFGADALWFSMPVGSAFTLLVSSALYLAGNWRGTPAHVPPTLEENAELALGESDQAGRMTPTG